MIGIQFICCVRASGGRLHFYVYKLSFTCVLLHTRCALIHVVSLWQNNWYEISSFWLFYWSIFALSLSLPIHIHSLSRCVCKECTRKHMLFFYLAYKRLLLHISQWTFVATFIKCTFYWSQSQSAYSENLNTFHDNSRAFSYWDYFFAQIDYRKFSCAETLRNNLDNFFSFFNGMFFFAACSFPFSKAFYFSIHNNMKGEQKR